MFHHNVIVAVDGLFGAIGHSQFAGAFGFAWRLQTGCSISAV
jgi:hypothetical protein